MSEKRRVTISTDHTLPSWEAIIPPLIPIHFIGRAINPTLTGLCQHEQIGTGCQDVRMGSVFVQSTVSYLTIAEALLDDEEDVLNLTSYSGFLVFNVSVPIKAGRFGWPMQAVAGVSPIVDGR